MGIMLLSKKNMTPIGDSYSTELSSTAASGGVKGFLSGTLASSTKIICTHLSWGEYGPYPYYTAMNQTTTFCQVPANKMACNDAETLMQAKEIVKFTADHPGDYYLLGDWNTGPPDAKLQGAYKYIVKEGWISQMAGTTWNEANTLVFAQGAVGATYVNHSSTIDHVFTNFVKKSDIVSGILMPKLVAGGDLSDHY